LFRQMLAASKQVVDPQVIMKPRVLLHHIARHVGLTGECA
jgi:hypothetical protein